MKFSSRLYIQRGSASLVSSMASSNKWWVLCAVSLCCVARLGSCRRNREDGALPELFIFNELCALKDDPGHCKAIKDRFFFNVDTGRCELFEYGGCGGNANNFETLEACEETCVVSEDKNPCHLDEAPGPCRGLVTRYLFDSRSQQCRHFFYGGCFGNANNFRSMAECQAKCLNPAKPTRAPEVHTQSAVQPTIINGEQTVSLSQPQVQTNDTNQPKGFMNVVTLVRRRVETRGRLEEREHKQQKGSVCSEISGEWEITVHSGSALLFLEDNDPAVMYYLPIKPKSAEASSW